MTTDQHRPAAHAHHSRDALVPILINKKYFSTAKRQYFALAILCITSLFTQGAYAGKIEVLLSSNSAPYKTFYDSFAKTIEGKHDVLQNQHMGPGDKSFGIDLFVGVGARAAGQIARLDTSKPMLFGLIPKARYQGIIANPDLCKARRCNAVFIEQPFRRQLNLIKIALPRVQSIAVLTGPGSREELQQLTKLAENTGLKIHSKHIRHSDELIFGLNRLLRTTDALLSLPDPAVFNAQTAQSILLTAYRQNKPVLGYSRAYVNAGALLSAYSTPTQLGRQAAETAMRLLNNASQHIQQGEYPRYYAIAVNQVVAKSLDIPVSDTATLKASMEILENE